MSWTDEQIAEMQRHDDQVRHTVEKLKADRDTARAEAERLRDLFEASSQVAHELRAERDRLAERAARVRVLHAPIGTLGSDDGALVCAHCVTHDGQAVPHPCPTIRTMDGGEAQ